MAENIKDGLKLSAGTFIQLISILSVIVLSFALVKAQADTNTRDIKKNSQDIELIDEKQEEMGLLIRDYKGDIKSLIAMMNEVKYEIRQNRSEMKRWEYEREGKEDGK